MLDTEILAGAAVGGALIALAYRLRHRGGQVDLRAPLRSAEAAAGRVAGATATLASTAARGTADVAERVAGATATLAGTAARGTADVAERVAANVRRVATPAATAVANSSVIASATKYHRPECRYAGSGEPVDRYEAQARGLESCAVCEP